MRYFSACPLPALRRTVLLGTLIALAGYVNTAAAQSREVMSAVPASVVDLSKAKAVYKAVGQPRVKVVYRDRVVVSKPTERIVYRDQPSTASSLAEAGWNDAVLMCSKGDNAYNTKQYTVAMRYYIRASELGNPEAMGNLGFLYDTGQGVNQDDAQALIWYQKAAEAGDASGMYHMGFLYDTGQSVAQDYVQARAWYQKAANAGNTQAMENLGVLYEKGQGGTQDYVQARIWLQKAVNAGNVHAKRSLQEILDK